MDFLTLYNLFDTFDHKLSSLFQLNKGICKEPVTTYFVDFNNNSIPVSYDYIVITNVQERLIALKNFNAPMLPEIPDYQQYFSQTHEMPKSFIVFEIANQGALIFRLSEYVVNDDTLNIRVSDMDHHLVLNSEIPKPIDRAEVSKHLKQTARALDHEGAREFISFITDKKLVRLIDYDFKPKIARKIVLDLKKTLTAYKIKTVKQLCKKLDDAKVSWSIDDKDLIISK